MGPSRRRAKTLPCCSCTLATYTINADGTLNTIGAPVTNGQIAGC
jgi:hypothetical protein